MVDDPIFIGDDCGIHNDCLEPFIGQTIMVITSGVLCLELITDKCTVLTWNMKWAIFNGRASCYKTNSNLTDNQIACSKAELLDWMKERYPKHFEWILFHSEWLL